MFSSSPYCYSIAFQR